LTSGCAAGVARYLAEPSKAAAEGKYLRQPAVLGEDLEDWLSHPRKVHPLNQRTARRAELRFPAVRRPLLAAPVVEAMWWSVCEEGQTVGDAKGGRSGGASILWTPT